MPQGLTRRSLLAAAAAMPCGSMLARAGAPALTRKGRTILPGINLAGAEFGRVPGVIDIDYSYPGPAHLDYFKSLGLSLVRLPFRWERLQPKLLGPFDRKEWARLEEFVKAARERALTVVLDPHNYAKRKLATDGWSAEHVIGSPAVPVSAFADFWSRLAVRFKASRHVAFGLMNEPHGISVSSWLEAANAAVAAIRATGADHLILVPGTNWTGAHSWLASGNGAMAGINDPMANYAFEVHQYLDADSSGTSPVAVSENIGSERLQEFVAWARHGGHRAFLGEFGFADNPTMLAAGRNLLAAVEDADDVWIGWAAWAGGPRWPESKSYLLEPRPDGLMRPQTRVVTEAAVRLRLKAQQQL